MKVLSRTPSRISLFGGGTDMQNYSAKFGGITVSLAINLYQELVLNTGEDIFSCLTHIPANIPTDFAFSILKSYGIGSMHYASIQTSFDGIVGAGLGSSGAFGVALVAAIRRSRGQMLYRDMLAIDAWSEENKLWTTGKQDQFAATYGGFNILKFGKDTEVISYTRDIGDHITNYLHLFYTGGTRRSAKLQTKFDKLTKKKADSLHQIKDIALIAAKAILEGKMDLVGKLLHASWEIKKQFGVSTDRINKIYEWARASGALGGKLLGAGESGYMVFFVPPEKSKHFTEQMAILHLEENDFEIDYNGVMTRIL